MSAGMSARSQHCVRTSLQYAISTFYKVSGQDKHVLQDICSLCSALEYALRLAISEQQRGVRLNIAFNGLLSLLLPDLVYCLDLLQVRIGNRLCSDCALPTDWPRPDVILQ